MPDSLPNDLPNYLRLKIVERDILSIQDSARESDATLAVHAIMRSELVDLVREHQDASDDVAIQALAEMVDWRQRQLQHLKRLGEAAEAALVAEYGETFVELGAERRPGGRNTDEAK